MTPGPTRRAILAGAAALAVAGSARAETRPIVLIVPFPAASTPDLVARALARLLERELSRAVDVVNRAGSGGLVGHTALALAEPDGATLGLVTAELALHRASLAADMSIESLTPLALLGHAPGALVVRGNADWRSAPDLVGALRQPNARLRVGGGPANGFWALAMGGLARTLGVDPSALAFTATPTAARAFQDLAGGTLDLVVAPLVDAGPLIDNATLRPLALLDRARLPRLDQVPTLGESMPGAATFAPALGVAAPRGVPAAIVARLGGALARVMAMSAWDEVARARDLVGPGGDGQRLVEALGDIERTLAPRR